jgi:hypothetical protein
MKIKELTREGWEMCIVTDGLMVGILLGERSQCEDRVMFWRLLPFNQSIQAVQPLNVERFALAPNVTLGAGLEQGQSPGCWF